MSLNECAEELGLKYDFPMPLGYDENYRWTFSSIVPAPGVCPARVVFSSSKISIIGSNAIDFTSENDDGGSVVINVPSTLSTDKDYRSFQANFTFPGGTTIAVVAYFPVSTMSLEWYEINVENKSNLGNDVTGICL